MKFIPSSPVVFVLVIVAFFAMGMLAGKMFGKKKAVKVEKFDDDMVGEYNTPNNMALGPKTLPKVPENIGVVSGDTWCKKFNC
jgi:hypothetical protein